MPIRSSLSGERVFTTMPGQDCLAPSFNNGVVWPMMLVNSVGQFYIVEAKMNQHKYINALYEILLSDTFQITFQMGAVFFSITEPFNAEKYSPHLERLSPTWLCNAAKLVSAFLKNKNISILSWPGNSLEMNPIESLWMIVKQRTAQHMPTDKVTLTEKLFNVWENDPEIKEIWPKLIIVMPKRFEQLIKAKGASTKYYI